MDPLTITASCVSLAAAITKSSTALAKFVRDIRDSRRDLDAVSRELLSLKTVLDLLAEDAELATFPSTLSKQITGIVCNCTDVVLEIERVLERHDGGTKTMQAARWATIGHEDMAKLRSNLEAHKSALEIALDMVALTLARETNTNTIEILHDTSAIKEDTALILAEISRLQQQLPRGSNRRSATEFMLERYLGNLGTYAETVCDSFSDESIPPMPEVNRDEWTILFKHHGERTGRQRGVFGSQSSFRNLRSIGSDMEEDSYQIDKKYDSKRSLTPISDDWWEDEDEIPIAEAESFVIASPRKGSTQPSLTQIYEEDKKRKQSSTSTNTDTSQSSSQTGNLLTRKSQTQLSNRIIIPPTEKKSRQGSNTSNTVRFTTPSPTRTRRKSFFGSAGTLATALETVASSSSSSSGSTSSQTQDVPPRGRQSPLLRKAEALLGVRLKESNPTTAGPSQMEVLSLGVLKPTKTHHFPIDRPGFPRMVVPAYEIEKNEYNHVRFSALRFQPGEFPISGHELRQDLRQPPRMIRMVFSIYVPRTASEREDEGGGLMVTVRSLKRSLDLLGGDRGVEDFGWRGICVVVVSEEGAVEEVVAKEMGIQLKSVVEIEMGNGDVVAKLHETTAFLPFGNDTRPTQFVFLSHIHNHSQNTPQPSSQAQAQSQTQTPNPPTKKNPLMHWIEAIEQQLRPTLGVRLYAGVKVEAIVLSGLWDDSKSKRSDSNGDKSGKGNVVTYKERRRSSLGFGKVLWS